VSWPSCIKEGGTFLLAFRKRASFDMEVENVHGRHSAILGHMIPVGSHPVWHPVFETLAYAAGYAVFRQVRARQGDVVAEPQRWTVLAAAAIGALVGSRLLGLAEQWPTVRAAWQSGHLLALLVSPGGKTIVGGLLGGWLGVELIKRVCGIRRRTGDLFALPLCVGIAIGRIGCFIAGLADDTYGQPTHVPWAVDFGDGIGRHPVQIYEILFLFLVGVIVSTKANLPEGARFRIFIASYLAWRLAIDFLKPQPLLNGMNVIQWACAVGLAILGALYLNDRSASRRKVLENVAMG
jgi:phosphatidylglycerol:prolipoprotein diacylglycerol transferase